ncbi:pseudouridine synthase [Hirschia litorea]|uniref:Dual-specificity RNA pseudouridine synthase RluF n=1 Tax=Hirschia litorea TaxID=1199156 RepID=A0ABW2IJA6_9PROT
MAWTKTYDGDEPQRINKWLGQSGVCSRREAEGLVEQGLISIDGVEVTEPGRKIVKGETLTLADAATKKLASAMSVVLNKPVDYVSAHPNEGEIPAIRLITKANLVGHSDSLPHRDSRLAPVGRLDKDSRGLLILTEDGVLTKSVIGPEADSEKEYLVTVRGVITPERVQDLCHGLMLDNRVLKPAIVTHERGQLLRFILTEGRNRQIRRMCDLVGLKVVDLFRIRIGHVHIGDLAEGKWRALTPAEREGLIHKSQVEYIPQPDPEPPTPEKSQYQQYRERIQNRDNRDKPREQFDRKSAGFKSGPQNSDRPPVRRKKKPSTRPKYPGS